MICPKCCVEVPDNAMACPECKFNIDADKKASKTSTSKIGGKLHTVGLVIGCLTIISSLIMIFVGIFSETIFAIYGVVGIISSIAIIYLFDGFGSLVDDTNDIKLLLQEIAKQNQNKEREG